MVGVKYLHTDTETRSAVDLTSCGLSRYVDDDSFSVLLIAYALDDGPVTVLDLTQGAPDVVLQAFKETLYDPTVVKQAWNSQFERRVFGKLFGEYLPPEQWLDPMVLSASCGLPLSLGQVSEALRLPSDKAKDKRGRDLIRKFCNPKKDGSFRDPKDFPEEWAEFVEYNRQDVVAEREIFNLLKQWIPDASEHKLWCLDARINERGVPIDRVFAEQADEMGNRFKAELTDRALEITGLDNPNSVAQVKAWLQDQEGVEVPTLNKKVVADVVAQFQTDQAKEFMDIRAMMAKTSVKKYEAMLRCTRDDDAHARYCFQFFGSHTGRWAGRLIQLQNLSKNEMKDLAEARSLVRDGDYDTARVLYDNIPDVLSQLIRTALVPEPGQRFVVCDYSAIEARVTAWLSGEQWRLDAFNAGEDIYCASASQMFHVPVVKHGINGELRQKGKVAELALGYGGGVNALKAFGADKLGMTDEEMGETVGRWRESSPKIVQMWKKLERAAIACASRHTEQDSGIHGVKFQWEKGIMWMTLPSGRRMGFFNPEYTEFSRKLGDGKCLTYMVLNQTTRKWQRTETWGGKLTENLVQACARDCLKEALLNLDRLGWDIRAHVHDEIICTEPIGSGRGWKDMAAAMCPDVPWMAGLPIRADGYECEFYQKD